jgi:hypothetical protein
VNVATFCWLEGDEKSDHTNPQLPSGLRPTVLRAVMCSMPIAMKGLGLWPTTKDVVLGGKLDLASMSRDTRTK